MLPPGAHIGATPIAGARTTPDDGARRMTRAIARGDAEAFNRLYDAWYARALREARTCSRRDEAFCLDAVQDAMLIVARRIPQLDSWAQVDAWMRRVVVRCTLDRLRAERRRIARESSADLPLALADPMIMAEMDERLDWLRAELARLPQPARGIIAQRLAGGRIADAAPTRGAAYGTLRRALTRLRDRARETFGDD